MWDFWKGDMRVLEKGRKRESGKEWRKGLLMAQLRA